MVFSFLSGVESMQDLFFVVLVLPRGGQFAGLLSHFSKINNK